MTVASGMPRILFVCRGNLCRSPMAMALLQHRLATGGLSGDVEVDSAGFYDWGPFPREAHPFARRAVEHLCGSDLLADHIAKRWSSAMVEDAAFVVVAEEWMRGDFPGGKTVTMRELAGEKGDVPDPYGGDLPAFVDCAREIDRLIAKGWWRLLGGGART